MLIEFVERGIMYRELEKGERRRKGERWGGERGREIQREPIEPATMKSRSRSRKGIKRKKRREKGGDGRKKRMKKRERERGRDEMVRESSAHYIRIK